MLAVDHDGLYGHYQASLRLSAEMDDLVMTLSHLKWLGPYLALWDK